MGSGNLRNIFAERAHGRFVSRQHLMLSSPEVPPRLVNVPSRVEIVESQVSQLTPQSQRVTPSPKYVRSTDGAAIGVLEWNSTTGALTVRSVS